MTNFDYWLWATAGFLFGGAMAFVAIAYLLKPAIYHWEGNSSHMRLLFATLLFLGGSGGGTALAARFEGAPQFFLIGSAVGVFLGCFHNPILIVKHTAESVRQVLVLNALMPGNQDDLSERATIIRAALAPFESAEEASKAVQKYESGLDDLGTQFEEQSSDNEQKSE